MAQTIQPIVFTPDPQTGLDPFTVLPDSRDLYALRDMCEQRKWDTNIGADPMRHAYGMGWLAARRTGAIGPDVKFGDFVAMYAMDAGATTLEVDPTVPEAWDG